MSYRIVWRHMLKNCSRCFSDEWRECDQRHFLHSIFGCRQSPSTSFQADAKETSRNKKQFAKRNWSGKPFPENEIVYHVNKSFPFICLCNLIFLTLVSLQIVYFYQNGSRIFDLDHSIYNLAALVGLNWKTLEAAWVRLNIESLSWHELCYKITHLWLKDRPLQEHYVSGHEAD